MAITELELELPPLRTDLDDVKADLDRLGVARIADALSPAEVAALRDRLEAQAEAERAAGLAFMDGGGVNQRLWNLPDKYRWGVLTYFCRPWVRPQENYAVSTHPGALAEMSPEVRAMLGFKVWHTLGGVQRPWGPGTPDAMGFRTITEIDRDTPYIGPLGL